jgi:hypothetical protein
MKKGTLLCILVLACLLTGLVNGCKKDSLPDPPPPPTDIGTAISFTEEFDTVFNLPAKGWVIKDLSASGSSGPYAAWAQAYMGFDKAGVWSGFTAYSYATTQDEFAYSLASSSSSPYTISGWLITPVLSVKNGDKISFYTRGDTAGIYTDRMQVLMNKSASEDVGNKPNSTGDFTTVLFDINSSQAAGGYPLTWTKYEYIFSGISGKTDTRIAFRHYVTNTTNAKGIGVDLFRFQVN